MSPAIRLVVLLAAAALSCAGCDVTGKAPSAPAYRQHGAAPLSNPPSSAP